MIQFLLRLRYVAIIVVFFSVIDAVGLILFGILETLKAYSTFLHQSPLNLDRGSATYIIQSIDSFLISLVLLVLAIGITQLFLAREEDGALPVPEWMKVRSLFDLKLMLWQAVLLTLVIAFVDHVAAQAEEGRLEWTVLILPVAILMLTASLFIMGKISHTND